MFCQLQIILSLFVIKIQLQTNLITNSIVINRGS